jgi:hypothetical protein
LISKFDSCLRYQLDSNSNQKQIFYPKKHNESRTYFRKDIYMSFWEWVILFTVIMFFAEMLRNDPRPWDHTPWILKVILRSFGDFLWIVVILAIIKGIIFISNT